MFTYQFKVIHMNSYIISPFFTVFSSHQVAHDIKGKVSDKVQNGILVIHFLILLFSIPLTSSSFFLMKYIVRISVVQLCLTLQPTGL